MYHKEEEEGWGVTRILEVVNDGDKGYYFTIHEGDELLYISHHHPDRVAVTQDGLAHLDRLTKLDQKYRQEQKGAKSGQ